MSRIELKDVTVEFPIFSANSRSLKNAVLSATTGGHVGRDRHNYVCVRALDQVSIEIKHGERVGLVGHNGAGKTTLLRVIAGIYEPLQGSVIIEGTPTPMFDVSLGIVIDARPPVHNAVRLGVDRDLRNRGWQRRVERRDGLALTRRGEAVRAIIPLLHPTPDAGAHRARRLHHERMRPDAPERRPERDH